MAKGKEPNITAGTLAEQLGLSRAFALDPEALEAAAKRGVQPIAPFPSGYGPITEPALGFKARA
jgi:hypothetical protein